VDELLYKFPEAASMRDASGKFPLTLAIQSGKQWIGGGIKSLYDAYPEALQQIHVSEHPSLQRALSMLDHNDTDNTNDADKEQKDENGIIKDEHHDAIMLVQQENVDVSEVATSMWAHEEDAGVQMLGCVALSKLLLKAKKKTNDDNNDNNDNGNDQVLIISLWAVAAVVNAMKAHPNEMIIQENVCQTLKLLSTADNQR
jgi:hypothetical protein